MDNRTQLRSLEAALTANVSGEVRFDDASRALYATDSSNYRQVPLGVVVPRTEEDIVATLDACRRHDAPILARGGGTSLAGQCCNVAVVLDTSKYYNRILDLDPQARRATVQPGIVLDTLRREANRHGLTFGPDPATHNRCTLGGMLGNNSCGVHSVYAGRTADNVVSLDVLTYDGTRMTVGATGEKELAAIVAAGGRRGTIYGCLRDIRDRHADLVRERYPVLPRRVSGYNLDELLPERNFQVARSLVGSEGTCAIILAATLRLVPNPPRRCLLVLGYDDVFDAAAHVEEVLAHEPVGLEGIDRRLVQNMRKKDLHVRELELLPEGGGWLLAEFGGETQEEAEKKAKALLARLGRRKRKPAHRLLTDPGEQKRVWEVRESALGATAFVPGEKDAWPGWEDAAVPPARLSEYLKDLRALYDEHGLDGALYGHFGEGCVHSRIDFDLTSEEGIANMRSFVEEAADLVTRYGGSLSGEHGDGQARGELLTRMYGEEVVALFRAFKAAWDPLNRMNPGKVVSPRRLDEDLRVQTPRRFLPQETHFRFTKEGGFERAALRCVGVGKCRRTDGGTMCPSYMATREEMHSTRGRARLLFEMLAGDPLQGGWRNEQVKEALDLCLACKGCKGECPVDVDMAKYKAEFLSHYYETTLRPRSAYTMGWIHRWAKVGSLAPWLANFLTQTPGLAAVAKAVAGVAPERRIPRFAPQTFSSWFRWRHAPPRKGPRVILWPDTFNEHFHPGTLRAGAEVLERAGFRVELPGRWLCCGRPLYDYGMLPLAKRLLSRILDTLSPRVAEGVCVVGLEPSCVATFRDELLDLFPDDERAKRLAAQTYLLSEFLVRKADGYVPPRRSGRAVVHAHCHHKSVLGTEAEREILERTGLDLTVLDSGCCGMAGAFGFEKEHYEVSMRVGERVLLPAVREAGADALVVANGFSCREQVQQATGRLPLHLAELLND